jgi:hypothetical protein
MWKELRVGRIVSEFNPTDNYVSNYYLFIHKKQNLFIILKFSIDIFFRLQNGPGFDSASYRNE